MEFEVRDLRVLGLKIFGLKILNSQNFEGVSDLEIKQMEGLDFSTPPRHAPQNACSAVVLGQRLGEDVPYLLYLFLCR